MTTDNQNGPLPDPETLLIIGIGAAVGAVVALAASQLGKDIGPKLPSPAPVAAVYKFLNDRFR